MEFLSWIINFIRLPHKARSFGQLAELLSLHQCTLVFGSVHVSKSTTSVSGGPRRAGQIGTLRFSLEFASRGRDGRLVQYGEILYDYAVREWQQTDSYSPAALRAFYTLSDRLKTIQELLHLSTAMIDPYGNQMEEDEVRKIRAEAAKAGILPADPLP